MKEVQRGKLRIFFSCFRGTGKTSQMISEALAERDAGKDVIIGVLSDDSADTCGLLTLSGPGESFDLDEALEKAPDLIVMDDLAGTNLSGRHRRRYEDVRELLDAGIDVYSTLNLGNIESLRDAVAAVTGEALPETVPDSVFDGADRVDLIDAVQQSGDDPGRLSALREMALRRCADRMRLRQSRGGEQSYRTGEHVLVCLSSSPSNARIIRTAARMASAFGARFTALYVETPEAEQMSEEDRDRLIANRDLAVSLGAYPETVHGDDVAFQIAEYSSLCGVTRIVIGRSAARRRLWSGPSLTDRLMDYAQDTDIHIIPDSANGRSYGLRRAPGQTRPGRVLLQIIVSLLILVSATGLSILFYDMGFTESNMIMVFILGVVMTSIATDSRIYSLVSSIGSVFIYNYLFTEPRFSLAAYGTGYPVTFLVMFVTAYVTGTLAARYKAQAGEAARNAYRTKILYDADRLMAKAEGEDEIFSLAGSQLARLLKRRTVLWHRGENGEMVCEGFGPEGEKTDPETSGEAAACAEWVLSNGRSAGRGTGTMSSAPGAFLPLATGNGTYAALQVEVSEETMDASETSILRSILGEAALAVENARNLKEKEESKVLARGEQLRANILRSISHDLRTPLTVISGNAGNLIRNSDKFDEDTRQSIYRDIYEDSRWLVNMVENLLYATRIEDGKMELKRSAESLGDIVDEAAGHIRDLSGRRLSILRPDDLIVVRADARLIVQVITNLADNAFKYSPASTPVVLSYDRDGGSAVVRVSDLGPGIPDGEKEKVFERFYRMEGGSSEARRSLGLGLYLCRCIIEAHGGTIRVEDNVPEGSVFIFTLPLEEIGNE